MKKGIILFLLVLGIIFPISLIASDTIKIVEKSFSPKDTTIQAYTSSVNDLNHELTTNNNDSKVIVGHISKNGVKENLISAKLPPYNREIPVYDSLLNYIQQYDIYKSLVYPRPAIVIDSLSEEDLEFPKMNPLYMPMVFNTRHREFNIEWRKEEEPRNQIKSAFLDSLRMEFIAKRYIHDLNRKILLSIETQQIGRIIYDQKNLPEPEKLIYILDSGKPTTWTTPFKSNPKEKPNEYVLPTTEYNPWTLKGNAKLQFSQTYISPNWSAGGESNMAGLTSFHFVANYSDLKKVQFDNSFDVKIGLNTVSSDTLRNLNVSTNQLTILSKLGIKMRDNLYYSLSGEFDSQFLNNYTTNTMSLTSAFLSPAKLYVGLGVDYKKSNPKKGYALSVLLTPLTYKMNYLNDTKNFIVSSYGIKEGHHFGNELGSMLSATLGWKLSENMNWNSKFYYYTNFTYVDTEWENTLDICLDSHFSTQIYIHPKLDDRLARTPGQPLVQMQELLSFGFSYHW